LGGGLERPVNKKGEGGFNSKIGKNSKKQEEKERGRRELGDKGPERGPVLLQKWVRLPKTETLYKERQAKKEKEGNLGIEK